MGFRACSRRDDPFERAVRETYNANVVGAPRAGIDPLTTVARQDDRVEPRGHLKYFFEEDPGTLPRVSSAPAAALSGMRSSELKATVGFDLTAKFLGALGLPLPGAEVTATLWDGAHRFSFEVRDVTENQIDLARLGQAIDGLRVADNAATSIFLGDPSQQLLLITRTLTASTFAVRATRAAGEAIDASVDGIADLVGSAKAGVSWKQETGSWVSFRGPEPVTFGFSVVPCVIDADRRLRFGLTRKDLTMGAETKDISSVVSRPVIDEDGRMGLLSFDE